MAETKNSLTFGEALEALKAGKKVARKGWNGKGMFLCFVHWKDWSVNPAETHKTSTHLAPWIGMKTADNMFVPWLASQTDMLAEDWHIVEQSSPRPWAKTGGGWKPRTNKPVGTAFFYQQISI